MTQKQFALIGLSAPLLFWTTYFIVSFNKPEYSFLTKAISELGSVDVMDKWFWNIPGYILTGLMISVFSIGLHKSISGKEGRKLPLMGLLLSGLFMALAGIFPGDFDNRQSVTMLVHTIGSFGSYFFFLIAAFTYSRQMRRTAYWSSAVKFALLFTWMTVVFGAWPFLFPSIPAVGQRIVFFFYLSWIFFMAIKLYRKGVIIPQTELGIP